MSRDGPILLIGGTRGTGLLIGRLLVQQGVPVRALARNPDDAARRLDPAIAIVRGDITKPATLPLALADARHIIFTAGRRSGRPFLQSQIRETEFEGVSNTLTAARKSGFAGRFLYMTASGEASHSFWAFALNFYKGNTLKWRARAETLIRESGLSYVIIRAGMLVNSSGGLHPIVLTRRDLPLSPRYRIARADVASVFVAAMRHPRADRVTFEIVWGREPGVPWLECLNRLEPDVPSSGAE